VRQAVGVGQGGGVAYRTEATVTSVGVIRTVATCARGKCGMSDGGKRGARQSVAWRRAAARPGRR
jgi:hypothetical protein